MVGSLVVLGILVLVLLVSGGRRTGSEGAVLRVACAAAVRPPVEAAAEAYARRYGVEVELRFGGTATLLAGLALDPSSADLLIAADDLYLEDGCRLGLLEPHRAVASLTPVLAFGRGNPYGLRHLTDLLETDRLRIGLPDPESTASGRVTRARLQALGLWEPIRARAALLTPTVVEVANALVVGSLDAAIVWDATVRQYPTLEGLEIEPLSTGTRTVGVAVVRETAAAEAAHRFARTLADADVGGVFFTAAGYEVSAAGDPP